MQTWWRNKENNGLAGTEHGRRKEKSRRDSRMWKLKIASSRIDVRKTGRVHRNEERYDFADWIRI